MQFTTRSVVAAATSALAACLLAAACSSAPATSAPASQPTSPTASVSAAPQASPSQSPNPTTRQAMAYLYSAERIKRFQSVVPRAGIAIAEALMAGRFGPIWKYNADGDKGPLRRDWIVVEAQTSNAYAFVFWQPATQSIDYSKPIIEIGLTDLAGSRTTKVELLGPLTSSSCWSVALASSAQVTGLTNIENSNSTPDPIYPTDLNGLKQLDNKAFTQFAKNMHSWFGGDWSA